ncbi:gypsy retrotransposon integrase 1-like protein [Plakobranchus ocellatus]|uniref:Gypsy retrotransposon integrase 1-like protein n=1 Tax=Plakobranchus ocellatus TaxID=259542 RepID=A0AAV3ZWN7_9GAST|nr:gypsy retrotransposon integrase 1-like protein [Plakobranchus ocellatus]
MFPIPPSSYEDPFIDSYITTLEGDVKEAHAQARHTLRSTQRRIKTDYDTKARAFHYVVGDAVYVCDKPSLKGWCDKLKSPWKGPGFVLAMITPYLMRIQIKN